jgi:hypothetical protein
VGVYVDECLRSIARQAIDAMEVIVVDDHSVDDTVARVRSIANADSRFRLMEADDRGGALARNLGASRASGRYLIFIDGDDIVPDGAFAALIDSLERTGSDMACGRYLKFSASRTWDPTQNWPVYKERLERITLDEHPALIRGRACWNKLFRRDFWVAELLVYPNVARSNDIVPMTKALVRAQAIDVIPEVVYLYRERPGSRSMSSRASQAAGVLSYLEQELACFDEIEPTLGPRTIRTYVSLLYQADLWVHLARFVPGADEEQDEEALRRVSELVATFIGRTPTREWQRIPPDRRRYVQFVAEGRYAALSGLDARGEIAIGPVDADPAAFAVVRATVKALSREGDAFDAVIARGIRHRIAEPMWAIGGDASDDALANLLREIALLDEGLPAAIRPMLTSNERQLINLARSADSEAARELIAALRSPAPAGSVRSLGGRSFALALELPDDSGVQAVRLVGRHRDSGAEHPSPWMTIGGRQVILAVTLNTVEWTAEGVWLLELDVRSSRLVYRRPVAATTAAPAEPSDRWASIRMSRVKRAGHHIAFVRAPARSHRIARAIVARVRRVLRLRS